MNDEVAGQHAGNAQWRGVMVAPDPAGTLRGLRNAGYTTEAAVADLLDNSLQSGATSICVDLVEDGPRRLEIRDNGHGMSAETLTEAMRISARPGPDSGGQPLGHYGIGMKAAALHLSSAGHMEVDSRDAAGDGGRTGWSLAGVARDGWILRMGPPERTEPGTTVTVHDPVLPETEEAGSVLASVAAHLGLVFAHFIRQGVQITVQGHTVEARDPCDPEAEGVRRLGPWPLPDRRGQVTLLIVPAAGLPTESTAEHRKFAGIHLRRAGRTITSGGWLQLLPARTRSDAADRLRLRIDIPGDEIEAWRIGVAKAGATIPAALLPRLREIVQDGLKRAGRQRGLRPDAGQSRSPRSAELSPWLADGRIDRAHPHVKAALDEPSRERVEQLLKSIERMI